MLLWCLFWSAYADFSGNFSAHIGRHFCNRLIVLSKSKRPNGHWRVLLCHNKSMLYKMLIFLEPFIHRSHLRCKGWNGNYSHLPSFCKNAGSCARLTQIYTNALLYICELELPTDRAVGSTIPADSTIFTTASNLTCDLCFRGGGVNLVFVPLAGSFIHWLTKHWTPTFIIRGFLVES